MDASLPVLAGTVSTTIFAGSVLPMLLKAARTHDLSSYSLGNIVLANAGNVVHSVYVLNLPPGPIWVLHGFYVASSALMLFWYLRFGHVERHLGRLLGRSTQRLPSVAMGSSPEAYEPVAS